MVCVFLNPSACAAGTSPFRRGIRSVQTLWGKTSPLNDSFGHALLPLTRQAAQLPFKRGRIAGRHAYTSHASFGEVHFYIIPCQADHSVFRESSRGAFFKKAASDCRKTPGELERVATLSNFQSRPAACTVGTGRFLRRKISFSRAKIVSLQFLRPEIS